MKTISTYYSDYGSLRDFVNNNRDTLLAETNSSVLVQVFAGICDRVLLLEISKQIRELVPGSQVIGATTNGEIMNGLSSGQQIVIAFSAFRQALVEVALLKKGHQSDFDLGIALGNSIDNGNARVLISFATGLTVNAAQFLKGIQMANPHLPVAGGNAGDNFNHHQCFVMANEEISDRGVVSAVLMGESLLAARHSHLGWQSIGKEMTITRAEESRVYTIDNIPAYQIYRHYLGMEEDLDSLSSFEFPLVLEKKGLLVSRIPHSFHDDDSLVFFGDIEEGEKVRFSFGHIDTIMGKLDNLLEWIRQKPVESIFVYSCGARRSLLGEFVDMETLPLQKIAPTVGFYTDGEFFHFDKSNQFLNNTITVLALSEEAEIPANTSINIFPDSRIEKAAGEFYADQDNVANRGIKILKALTCLANVVTSELNERSAELESQRHDFINHLHNLSVLLNLGQIEQAISYVSNIYREVKSSGIAQKLAVPEVTALLMTKMGAAYNRSITLQIEVESDLKGLSVKAMDIVAILGNMLNNALEAVDDLAEDLRHIELKIWDDQEAFYFQTRNPGFIPESIQTKIFEHGFSTKNGPGNRGLGLPSIIHLSKKYHGTLELSSLPEQGTTFLVKLPK